MMSLPCSRCITITSGRSVAKAMDSSTAAETGVIRLADSDDIQGNNFDGSDFLLVEVEDEIPSSWGRVLRRLGTPADPAQTAEWASTTLLETSRKVSTFTQKHIEHQFRFVRFALEGLLDRNHHQSRGDRRRFIWVASVQ